jgi:chromosome segregation ATPase
MKMKKTIAILLMMVILVMFVTGCVSQQDYDSLLVEYDALRARVESAESNLAAAQGEIAAEQSKTAKLESDLTASQGKVAKLEADLAAEQSQSQKLESDLTAERSEVQKLEKEVSAAQSEAQRMTGDYNAIKRKIDRAEPYAYILETTYWEESYELTPEQWIELTSLVDRLNDPEISEKYLAWIEATTQTKSDEAYGYFNWALWDGLYEALYLSGTAQ